MTELNVTMLDSESEWDSQFSDSLWIYLLMYSTISIAAVGGNAIVIYLISNFRQMHTVTNFFILNLAIGDLMMAIFCIPFTFASEHLFHSWPFGALMCRVVSYAQAVSVFISAYTLVAISIDRYIVILYPLRPRMTKRHSIQVVAFIWLVALLTPTPIAVVSRIRLWEPDLNQTVTTVKPSVEQSTSINTDSDLDFSQTFGTEQPYLFSTTSDYNSGESDTLGTTIYAQANASDNMRTESSVSRKVEYEQPVNICDELWDPPEYGVYFSMALMFLQYILPLAVLVFTYSRIAAIVWGKQTPGEAHDGRDARIAASKRKMIKMMIMCVVAFTLCWLPFNVLYVIGDLNRNIYNYEHMQHVRFACHWLAMSHTTYNPIIYIWMNARFRYGFRYTLGQCFPFMMPRQRRESNYSHSAVHVFDTGRPIRSTANLNNNGYSYAAITDNDQTSLSQMNMNSLFVKSRNRNHFRERTSDFSLLSVQQDQPNRRLSSIGDTSNKPPSISTVKRRQSTDMATTKGNNSLTITVPTPPSQNGNNHDNANHNTQIQTTNLNS